METMPARRAEQAMLEGVTYCMSSLITRTGALP